MYVYWYSITLLFLIKNIELNLPKRKNIQKDKWREFFFKTWNFPSMLCNGLLIRRGTQHLQQNSRQPTELHSNQQWTETRWERRMQRGRRGSERRREYRGNCWRKSERRWRDREGDAERGDWRHSWEWVLLIPLLTIIYLLSTKKIEICIRYLTALLILLHHWLVIVQLYSVQKTIEFGWRLRHTPRCPMCPVCFRPSRQLIIMLIGFLQLTALTSWL